MKFGTFITNLRPERIVTNIRKAEEVGMESAWIGEHIIMTVKSESKYPYSADGRFPAPADVPFHDPLLALAYAAAVTSKIKLATGIYVVPIRNHITTAKAIASLDVLSNGRVIFGIGVGWWAEEFAVVGAPFKDRALRTRESIELMKALCAIRRRMVRDREDPRRGTYANRPAALAGEGVSPDEAGRDYPESQDRPSAYPRRNEASR